MPVNFIVHSFEHNAGNAVQQNRGQNTMLFALSRRPGESRDPFCCCCQFNMDSGFRRNDELQATALIEQYWGQDRPQNRPEQQ